MTQSLINTLIVDDHAIFRAGLIKLLENNHQIKIVGELDSGDGLTSFLDSNPVDLIILDISLPRTNGLELIDEIRSKTTKAKILILSMHRVADYCRLALKRGAKGYVLKEDAFDQLNQAIDIIINQNKEYISPSITKAAADEFFTNNTGILPDILTKSEKVILEKIASGMSNKEVGKSVGISVRTVETHRAHILRKLKIKNTAGLVQYAIKQNLIHINKS